MNVGDPWLVNDNFNRFKRSVSDLRCIAKNDAAQNEPKRQRIYDVRKDDVLKLGFN